MSEYFPDCSKIELILLSIGILVFFITVVFVLITQLMMKDAKGIKTFGIRTFGIWQILGNLKIDHFTFIMLCSVMLMAGPGISRYMLKTDICGNRIDEVPKSLTNKLNDILDLNNEILQKVAEVNKNHHKSINIDGEYFYRSSVKQEGGMLVDEKGNPAYMFIGELTINNNQIIAERRFAVKKIGNQIKSERTYIKWDANHIFSSPFNMVIYKLATQPEVNPSNEGFFVGRFYPDEKNDNQAKKIEGEMHYMMKTSKNWTVADKVLIRKDHITNSNPYIKPSEIREWFIKIYGQQHINNEDLIFPLPY